MGKIRVLFIHNKLVCGGAEQALYDLCCLLDKTKFEVTVLEQYSGGLWEQKFRDAGIRVIEVWDWQKKSKNPFVKLNNYGKRKVIGHLLKNESKGLVDVCFRKKFDIIVSYSVWRENDIGMSSYAKTIKYIHGDVDTNEQYKESLIKMEHLLPLFDRIICVSDVARRSFQDLTGITESVETHWNPLNSSHVCKLAEEIVDIPTDVPVVCAVGRLAKEKGFDRLIRIHKDILDLHIPHKLIIVGDGPEKGNLEQVIEDTDTKDSVIMPGYASNPYPYMKNSMFMVCSSYTEGLPVIAMEALSLGVPIVSAVPSIGELFGDEICGIITENDDDSLKEGMIQMLTDERYYLSAKAGAEKRSSVFEGRQMVSKIENVFANLAVSK